jgi:hypothetical protein
MAYAHKFVGDWNCLKNVTLKAKETVRSSLAMLKEPNSDFRGVEIFAELLDHPGVFGNDIIHRMARYEGPLPIDPKVRFLSNILAQYLRSQDLRQRRRFVKCIPRLPPHACSL